MANYSKTKSVFSRSRQAYLLWMMQRATVLSLLATITGTCQRTCKSNINIKPKYVDLITQPKIRLPPKFKSILSHIWLCDLISRSGNVHPNPGPRQAAPPPTYPCGTCQGPVKNRDKSVICDEFNLCGTIYIALQYPHQPTTLSSIKINLLTGSANTAAFQTIGLHPHSPATNSQYHILIVMNTTMQFCMTPERQKKTQGNSLKGILINTNSVKSIEKATQLRATHYSNPSRDSNYQTYSFLPPNYVAIRKDRNAHGGGILIAFRDDITAESLDNLNSNCGIVWTKIHFARNKSIFFASYYTPPSDHLASLEACQAALEKKLYRSHKNTPNVVIAGDFNLPDIDWDNQQTTNTRTASKHNKILEIINEFGLVPFVLERVQF